MSENTTIVNNIPVPESDPRLDVAIAASVAKLLDEGIIQEKIDAALDKAVSTAIEDSMRYGKVRDAVKTRIEDALVPAIEGVKLDRLDVKLEDALMQVAEDSAFGTRRSILKNFAGLMSDEPECGYVTASDILKAQVRAVEMNWDCSGREIDYDDEPTYMPVCCNIALDVESDERRGYLSQMEDAKLVLSFDEEDGDAEGNVEEFSREVRLWRWKSHPVVSSTYPRKDLENAWYVEREAAPTFDALSKMTDADVLLSRMAMHRMPLVWDLDFHADGEYAELEDKPEADWN